jgi:hypothetical protein
VELFHANRGSICADIFSASVVAPPVSVFLLQAADPLYVRALARFSMPKFGPSGPKKLS